MSYSIWPDKQDASVILMTKAQLNTLEKGKHLLW